MGPFDLEDLPVSKAKKLTKAYRDLKGIKMSPFHFLPMRVFERLSGIPGIDGFKLYIGIKGTGANQKEVLILVPATVLNEGTDEEQWADILSYDYTINDYAPQAQSVRPIVVKGPCPPPPVKTIPSEMNSDLT